MRDGSCSEELAALEAMNRHELRVAWVRRMKTTPPNISVGLLRLALAHAIQSKAVGGITKSMDRRLRELSVGKTGPAPGTQFTRAWQGKIHVVTVTADEKFNWQGKEYNTLSQVACAITGTHWSGPAFFGTRKRPAP
jgi:hypothetical protein